MKTTNQTKIIDYVKNIVFKLKDFEKTSDKYINYKTDKRNELAINFDFHDIIYNAERLLLDSYRGRELLKDLSTKANIRQVKTLINYNTRVQIERHIDRYVDNTLNKNELKCFTIRTYLENYEKINELMNELLVGLVENNVMYTK